MKHMKRALSLVLAMVMLLGMMVIPTGAVSNFTDEAEITYNEAVEVTSGLGLFAGSDGKFMPTGTVTRAQMATIIVKMLHGSEANADSFKGINGGFTDTASFEGGWAEGYINWCASLGVVAGYGDGTFRPGQAVTTAEAVTMILNALKVNAGEGQWPITVMSKADELKFFKDLAPKPDTNQALTREELAVIAFHGLEYSPEGKMGYVYNGEVYDDYMAAYLAAERDASKVDPAKKDSLAADVFGLKTVTGFITGNQASGLDYTELTTIITVVENGQEVQKKNPYKFDFETDQTAIGHYVTVYYDEQYTNENKPGKTYTIFDEGTVVEVTEDIDSRADFRDYFSSTNVKLSTAEACVVNSDFTVKTGYPTNGGFAVNDVTFVTGNTYDVPAGTYILDGNTVMAYIAPPAVYASEIEIIDNYEGEESITLKGVNNAIPNNKGEDMIDEILAMQVGDYVTYVKVGERYVLQRVRVVTGKVTSTSTTKINDDTYDVITVGGVDYVAFVGRDAGGNPVGGVNHTALTANGVNYTDTYDFYVTGDGKFIGYETSDGSLNLDNVAYLLGVLKTTKKDSYGDQVINYTARGVDMSGVETMVLLAQVKDTDRDGVYDNTEELLGGKDAEGNVEGYINAPATFAAGFYKVKDHADKDARKEGIKTLDGFDNYYHKENSPVFTVDYSANHEDMSFTGKGTYNYHGTANSVYCLNQSTTRYLVLEGTLNQSTPLQAKLTTGSVSAVLDGANTVTGLASRPDGNASLLEAVVIPVTTASSASAVQYVYVSAGKSEYSGVNANGYVYDVYSAYGGQETQITVKEQGPLTPGFYRVALDPETQQHYFVDGTKNTNGQIPGMSTLADLKAKDSGTVDRNDGVPGSNVVYSQEFDFVYNSELTLVGGVFNRLNASGAAVVDTRTQAEMDYSRIARITSLDRISSLKSSNENLFVGMDIWFNSQTEKVTAIYITDVTNDARRGSLLVTDATDPAAYRVLATAPKDEKLTVDETYHLPDGKKSSFRCINGVSCNHKNSFFEFVGETPTEIILKHMTPSDGAGTLGQHNVVVRADGDEWVLLDAHGNPDEDAAASWGCNTTHMVCYNQSSGAEASMYLNVSGDVEVVDLAGTGITDIGDLKDAIAGQAADPKGNVGKCYVLNYYCKDGYGDETPEIIFIVEATGSLTRCQSDQLMWRAKAGEWVFYNPADTSGQLSNATDSSMRVATFTIPSSGDKTKVFLQYNEVAGALAAIKGQGVYEVSVNKGRTVLTYVNPELLTTTVDSNAVILKGPDNANTVTKINDLLRVGAEITGVVKTDNGKQYVYVESVKLGLTNEELAGVTLNFVGVHDKYATSKWIADHAEDITDERVIVQGTIAGGIATITNVYYKVTKDMVLYMAENPVNYYGKNGGLFYVIDPAESGLTAGQKYYFGFDEEYFYTTQEVHENARVFCYGWKDGFLLTTDGKGVRKDASPATNFYLSQDKSMWFGGKALYYKCLGYHRNVTSVDGASYTMMARNADFQFAGIEWNGWDCGHTMIGKCWSGNSHMTSTSLSLTQNTVIIDTRSTTNDDDRVLTREAFATKANEAAATPENQLVINFISDPGANNTAENGTEIKYLVITGLEPLTQAPS